MNARLEFLMKSRVLYLVSCDYAEIANFQNKIELLPDKDIKLKIIDGRECKDKKSLLYHFGKCLEFPVHYGQNWSALDDCICDLEWLHTKNLIITILNGHDIFENLPHDEIQNLLDIINEVLIKDRSIMRKEPSVSIIIHTIPCFTEKLSAQIGEDIIKCKPIDLSTLL